MSGRRAAAGARVARWTGNRDGEYGRRCAVTDSAARGDRLLSGAGDVGRPGRRDQHRHGCARHTRGDARGPRRRGRGVVLRHARRRACGGACERGEHETEVDLRVVTVSGAIRWTLVRMRARREPDGTLSLLGGSLADVDERKRNELQLRDDARRDALTSLPNRLALAERLTARIARAVKRPLPRFAVLFVDLDRFKQVNDRLGHATGDALLRASVERIKAVLGDDDLLARVGGDEFVILLDSILDEDEVMRLAEAMHEVMRALVPLTGRDVFTSLSIGVRVYGDELAKAGELLNDADAAMYDAKRQGGARTVVYDERFHRKAVDRLRVQSELAYALRRGELHVAYQPIFDVKEKRLRGFEALVRWHHPVRGVLSAAEFVDDADESGLIVLVGRWMLNGVCAQLAEWRRDYPHAMPGCVSLKLTDREIVDPGFSP